MHMCLAITYMHSQVCACSNPNKRKSITQSPILGGKLHTQPSGFPTYSLHSMASIASTPAASMKSIVTSRRTIQRQKSGVRQYQKLSWAQRFSLFKSKPAGAALCCAVLCYEVCCVSCCHVLVLCHNVPAAMLRCAVVMPCCTVLLLCCAVQCRAMMYAGVMLCCAVLILGCMVSCCAMLHSVALGCMD